MVRGPQFEKRWYSPLLLGYKTVQHVTVLNNVGNCNIMVSNIIIYYYYYILILSYGTNVVYAIYVAMWPTPVFAKIFVFYILLFVKNNVHHTFLAVYSYCILYYCYFIHLCNQISFGIKTYSTVCDG